MSRFVRFPALAFALLLPGSSMFVGVPAVGALTLQVHTQSGDVVGVSNGSVNEWRGIPYAAPPVGDLRWRPPEPVAPWSDVRDATEFAPPCIQPSFGPDGPSGTIGKESCLYLNVFAPASASATSGLPVMVHLHAGGNACCSPHDDASALVDRDVIVVTLAYRLGVFGFVGHPALSREGSGFSGEYGVLDQIAALRWVQDNVTAFGGDPSNVTLFGASAGSFDTVALMASPLSEGLFARAAVQGEVFWAFTGKRARIRQAEEIGRFTFGRFGCGDGRRTTSCLREQPARRVIAAGADMEVFDLLPWVGGEVLPEAPEQLLEGETSIPLLVGFDREEDRYFSLPFRLPDPYTKEMWIRDTNDLLGPTIAEQARALYPPRAYGSRAWAFVTMATDAKRGCPTRRLANEVAAPVWRWLFTHTYENDEGLAQGRAAHFFEEPFLWGTLDSVFGIEYTPSAAEELLSERMIGYWTNYAKTGNPNGPGLPTWPQYDTVTEPMLILDDEIGIVDGYHVDECALLDTVDQLYP